MKYTAGELARKLGISARTVRFYDEKNLLIPCGYSEAGYRLYNDESITRLQRILMLKFMDFSLEQISEMMQEKQLDIRESLKEQELLLVEKKEHIERVLEIVRKTRAASDGEIWEQLCSIIDITKGKENVIKQYLKDDNLNKRISIHDYSTAKQGWFFWLLDQVSFAPNMKILDIGCGNGSFWRTVAAVLPGGLEIHLVDYSQGMLERAGKVVAEIQNKYPEKGLKFVLEKRDATDFSYPVSGFDRIMANHMLYHVDRESRLCLYQKINELLAENGVFSCTLIGQTHLRELHQFVRDFYPEIKIPATFFDIWLETASEELKDYFEVCKVEEQHNDLLVPEEELVFNYVASYSKEASDLISVDKELFLERVRSKMNPDGYMYIHKSTGIVVCRK